MKMKRKSKTIAILDRQKQIEAMKNALLKKARKHRNLTNARMKACVNESTQRS